jgi:hypothetical protein
MYLLDIEGYAFAYGDIDVVAYAARRAFGAAEDDKAETVALNLSEVTEIHGTVTRPVVKLTADPETVSIVLARYVRRERAAAKHVIEDNAVTDAAVVVTASE